MKGANFEQDKSVDVSGEFPTSMERRKSYYHGKYDREVYSVIIVLASLAMFLLRQGI
jgi:hypothetical protein